MTTRMESKNSLTRNLPCGTFLGSSFLFPYSFFKRLIFRSLCSILFKYLLSVDGNVSRANSEIERMQLHLLKLVQVRIRFILRFIASSLQVD